MRSTSFSPHHLPLKLCAGFGLILLFLCACNSHQGKPNVAGIEVPVQIHRFEQDFFSIDTTRPVASLERLYQKYPSFLPLYFEYLSPVNFIVHQNGKTYAEAVLEYYRNIKPLYDSTQKKFDRLGHMEQDLAKNLRYVKYYFPDYRIPAFYTSVESLNPENPQEIYGTVLYHDTLIISLQMFLGKDF